MVELGWSVRAQLCEHRCVAVCVCVFICGCEDVLTIQAGHTCCMHGEGQST